MKVVFWWNIPCVGMIDVLKEYSNSIDTTAIVITGELSKSRLAMGWEDRGILFKNHVILRDDEWFTKGMQFINEYSDRLHVFNGITYAPRMRYLVEYAIQNNVSFCNMSEAYFNLAKGYKRILKMLYMSTILPIVVRHISRKSLGVICLSGGSNRDIKQFRHFGYKKIFPFGYFTDEDSENNILENKGVCVHLLCPGLLEYYKGVDILIRALSILNNKGVNNYICHITGTGCEKNKLVKLVNKLGLSERIIFEGVLDVETYKKLLKKIDVLIAPGRIEPWGIRINEAIQRGNVVIVSDGIGANYLIKESGGGAVFKTGSFTDLADKLCPYLQDEKILMEGKKRNIDYKKSISCSSRAGQLKSYIDDLQVCREKNKKMFVIHSGHLNVKSGGPALSAWLTVKGLRNQGVRTEIIMPPIESGDQLIDESACPIYYHRQIFGKLAYVPKMYSTLKAIGVADVYHIHGTWMYHGHAVSRYAKKLGKPYVVAPRGMLYPQALAHQSLYKKLSMALYQKKVFSGAACVQCTCMEEMVYYRSLGFKNPVAILPNPIEISGIIDREIPHKPIQKIGYLGRLHSRKRVERLIYAFADLREQLKDCRLEIIGDGDEKYKSFLEGEVRRLKLTNVFFHGFLTGNEKDAVILGLSYLVVPSDFENFGNIVTEALVRGVPVIASKGMPWQELEDRQCGWWISNDQHSINKTLSEAISLSEEAREEMGRRGKIFVQERYSVEALGQKMKDLYGWLINGGKKPDFVYD